MVELKTDEKGNCLFNVLKWYAGVNISDNTSVNHGKRFYHNTLSYVTNTHFNNLQSRTAVNENKL